MMRSEGKAAAPKAFTDVLKPFLQGKYRVEEGMKMSSRKMADYRSMLPARRVSILKNFFVDHIPVM